MPSALDFFLQAVEESVKISNPEEFSHLGESLEPDDEVLDMELDFRFQQLLAVLLQKNHELKLMGEEAEHSLDEELRKIGLSYAEIFLDPRLCPKEKIEEEEREFPGIKEKIDAIFESREGYDVQEMLPNLIAAGRMFRILVESKHGLAGVLANDARPFERLPRLTQTAFLEQGASAFLQCPSHRIALEWLEPL